MVAAILHNEVISTIKRQKASRVETGMAETLSERQHHAFPPSELQHEPPVDSSLDSLCECTIDDEVGAGDAGCYRARKKHHAGGDFERLLAVLDQCCQRLVLVLCLDEIFFHRAPILMAVEPHSMAWVAGQRGPDRSGESWCKVLANWPFVTRVVTDAGKGLERGVKLAREARRTAAEGHEDASARPLQMGLDVFHTQRELQRVVHGKWKRAERQLDTATEADHKLAQSKQHGRDARGVAQQRPRRGTASKEGVAKGRAVL